MFQLNITQLLGILHLQELLKGDVRNSQELGHLPTPVWIEKRTFNEDTSVRPGETMVALGGWAHLGLSENGCP